MVILALPAALWHLYLDHLWNYQEASWVASTAYTFRVLAFVTIAPFVLLTLLDVTSYVIVRTLGVVDDTKASTSETTAHAGTPGIVMQDGISPSESEPEPESDATTVPRAFFRRALGEEGSRQLAGVGMFSPTPSQPPSPASSRRELSQHLHYLRHEKAPEEEEGEEGEGEDEEEDEERGVRPRRTGEGAPRDASRGSSSGESSYALLEPESGSEDAEVMMHKRMRAPADGS